MSSTTDHKKHLEQARSNRDIFEFLIRNKSDALDWLVITAFYYGIQVVDAKLAKLSVRRGHRPSHAERKQKIAQYLNQDIPLYLWQDMFQYTLEARYLKNMSRSFNEEYKKSVRLRQKINEFFDYIKKLESTI